MDLEMLRDLQYYYNVDIVKELEKINFKKELRKEKLEKIFKKIDDEQKET